MNHYCDKICLQSHNKSISRFSAMHVLWFAVINRKAWQVTNVRHCALKIVLFCIILQCINTYLLVTMDVQEFFQSIVAFIDFVFQNFCEYYIVNTAEDVWKTDTRCHTYPAASTLALLMEQ
jgi:hypothetical protein